MTTPGGVSPLSSTEFRYDPAPGITKISRAHGAAGSVITIAGRGFAPGDTTVRFGTKAATRVLCLSATSCRVTVPTGKGTVEIRIVTPGGTSLVTKATRFTFAG